MTSATETTNIIDPSVSHEGMYKRSVSDSSVIVVIKGVDANEKHSRPRHKKAPTYPEYPLERMSFGTAETESLTDTECTVLEDHIYTLAPLPREDIVLSTNRSIAHLQCYDAFVSLNKDAPCLDGSFRMIQRLSRSNMIDVASLRQLDTNKSTDELQKKACLKQLHLPIFYISVLYAAAGFLFTISELQFGFSASSLQNIYLTGSTLYLCGSIGILGRAWMNVSNEWDLLQQSRMALYAMTSRGLNLEIL